MPSIQDNNPKKLSIAEPPAPLKTLEHTDPLPQILMLFEKATGETDYVGSQEKRESSMYVLTLDQNPRCVVLAIILTA